MPGHPDPATTDPATTPASPGVEGAWPGGPLLDAAGSAAALAVAGEVGARVADPDRVGRAAAAAARQTAHPASVHWRDHAVGQGHAGLALLFGALDTAQPGQGWDRTAHRHLEVAARSAEAQPRLPAGLFAGLAGLGLVGACLAGDGGRYRRLLAGVDQALAPRAAALADRVGRTFRPGLAGGVLPGPAVRDVDLISGLTGIAAYLLWRRAEPGPAAALRRVLATLAARCGEGAAAPPWHTPPEALPAEERARFPFGKRDCGLAHGIPGPLAVLSLALDAGVAVEGLPEGVGRTAGWLATNRTDDPFGPNWPNVFPLPPVPAGGVGPGMDGVLTGGDGGRPGPARAAWCYGGPGVAVALRLAGEALDHAAHRELAGAALEAALAKPPAARRIDSPTFCHGQAGLLAITSTFARATGRPAFRQAAAALAADLVDRFDPDAPLGYRDVEAGGRAIDQPGLLTGAPGVALALLGAAATAEPAWARLFLLA